MRLSASMPDMAGLVGSRRFRYRIASATLPVLSRASGTRCSPKLLCLHCLQSPLPRRDYTLAMRV